MSSFIRHKIPLSLQPQGKSLIVLLLVALALVHLIATSQVALSQQKQFDPQDAVVVFDDLEATFLNIPATAKRDTPNPNLYPRKFGGDAYQDYTTSWQTGTRRLIVSVSAFNDAKAAKAYLASRIAVLKGTMFQNAPVPNRPEYHVYRSNRMAIHLLVSDRFVASVTVGDKNVIQAKPEVALLDLLVTRLGGVQSPATTEYPLTIVSADKNYKDFEGVFSVPVDDDTAWILKVTVLAGGAKQTGAKVSINDEDFSPGKQGEYVHLMVKGTGTKQKTLDKTVELAARDQHYRLVFEKDGMPKQYESVGIDPEVHKVTIVGHVLDERQRRRSGQDKGVPDVKVTLEKSGTLEKRGDFIEATTTDPGGDFRFEFKQATSKTTTSEFTHERLIIKMVANPQFEVKLDGKTVGVCVDGTWTPELPPPTLRIPSEPTLAIHAFYLDADGKRLPLDKARIDVERIDNEFSLGAVQIPTLPKQPSFARIGRRPDQENPGVAFTEATGIAELPIQVNALAAELENGIYFGDTKFLADRLGKLATKMTMKITPTEPVPNQKAVLPFAMELPFDVLVLHGAIERSSSRYLVGEPRAPGRYHLASARQRLGETLDPTTGKPSVNEIDQFWLLVSRNSIDGPRFLNDFFVTWEVPEQYATNQTSLTRAVTPLVGRPLFNSVTRVRGQVESKTVPPARSVIDLGTAVFDPSTKTLSFKGAP